ncbi:MAG: hypothetical protein JOS17DRAFT_236962 [Linnemannia elongata]|nr:MAG: hypothetical protein JOS17DRAFT_236962 [Linnemannia elongata]
MTETGCNYDETNEDLKFYVVQACFQHCCHHFQRDFTHTGSNTSKGIKVTSFSTFPTTIQQLNFQQQLLKMSNPPTHTTTTSTTTTTTKPTTMERVKEKATQIADKLAGKPHDPNIYHDSNQPGPGFHGANNNNNLPSNTGNTANAVNPAATYHAGQHPVDALHTLDNRNYNNQTTTMPMHTGAAVGDAAVPHGNTVNRAAYQDTLGGQQGLAGHTGPAVPPKDDHKHHHGLFGHKDKHDKYDQPMALGGAQATDPNLIHPSVVPHQQTTNVGGLQNPAAAGPTGTSHVPTYNQNIPPTATSAEQVYPSSGGDLMGSHQDRHLQAHVQSAMAGPGATTTAAGTQIPPMNANNSAVPMNQQNMQQAAPGGVVPQNVPAMGAPGTTTAAGTHMPGQYVA